MLDYITVQSRGETIKQVFILLHGWGSNKEDLYSLAQHGLSKHVEDTLFISIDAPYICDVGFGKQWYSLEGYNPQEWEHKPNITPEIKEIMQRDLGKAAEILEETIDKLKETFKFTDEQIILGGFSQGGIMSILTGFLTDRKFKGIVSLSGLFVNPNVLEISNKELTLTDGVPVFAYHGTWDDVLPFECAQYTYDELGKMTKNLSFHKEDRLAHQISPQEIDILMKWLNDLK